MNSVCQEGHLANLNKQNRIITRCHLTFENSPTMPLCRVEGVVVFELRSRYVKR